MDTLADSPINILVVDDHGIVRDGVVSLLDGNHHMKVVGAVANGIDAYLFESKRTGRDRATVAAVGGALSLTHEKAGDSRASH